MTYHDLIVHRGIAIVGRSRSTATDVLALVARLKVVSHLAVQLLGRLLGRTRALGSTGGLSATAPGATSTSVLGGGLLLLVGHSRLGLRLGLRDAVSQGLGCRCNLGSLVTADDDLDLDRSAVDQKSVQLVESLGGTITLAESDGGNTTAGTAGAICKLQALDGTDRGDKVLLRGKSSC